MTVDIIDNLGTLITHIGTKSLYNTNFTLVNIAIRNRFSNKTISYEDLITSYGTFETVSIRLGIVPSLTPCDPLSGDPCITPYLPVEDEDIITPCLTPKDCMNASFDGKNEVIIISVSDGKVLFWNDIFINIDKTVLMITPFTFAELTPNGLTPEIFKTFKL